MSREYPGKPPPGERALGLIETRGLIGAIEAADAMVKAAKVTLIDTERTGGALFTIKIVGEVGAVRSAVDAGAIAAAKVGKLISTHIIPRPNDEVENLLLYDKAAARKPSEKSFRYRISVHDLQKLSVRELRSLARKTEGFPLSGREISNTGKSRLISELQKLLPPLK